MNICDAHAETRGVLRFGSSVQIEALKLLRIEAECNRIRRELLADGASPRDVPEISRRGCRDDLAADLEALVLASGGTYAESYALIRECAA